MQPGQDPTQQALAKYMQRITGKMIDGIEVEVDGELANGGQLIAGCERAGGNRAAHLVHDLAVDGHAAVQVEEEAEAVRSGP